MPEQWYNIEDNDDDSEECDCFRRCLVLHQLSRSACRRRRCRRSSSTADTRVRHYFTPGISSVAAVSVSASLPRRLRVRSSSAVLALNRRRLRPLQNRTMDRPVKLVRYRRGTYFCVCAKCCCALFYWTSNLLDRATAPHLRYTRSWLNLKYWRRHSVYPSPNFYRGSKSPNLASIFGHSSLRVARVSNRSNVSKIQTNSRSAFKCRWLVYVRIRGQAHLIIIAQL